MTKQTRLRKKLHQYMGWLAGPAGMWLATFTGANKTVRNATHLERKSEFRSTGAMRKTT